MSSSSSSSSSAAANTVDECDQEFEEVKPLDKWDGSAVKNRLDDAVKIYFTQDLGYVENFFLIDVRLFISVLAVATAVFALVWDYLNPFPASRPLLLCCVAAYFVFMVLLTFYTTMVEKGIFLQATKDHKSVTVSSYMKRFDDLYQLFVEQKLAHSNVVLEEKLEYSVARWFDTEGYFLEKRFEDDLKALLNKLQRRN